MPAHRFAAASRFRGSVDALPTRVLDGPLAGTELELGSPACFIQTVTLGEYEGGTWPDGRPAPKLVEQATYEHDGATGWRCVGWPAERTAEALIARGLAVPDELEQRLAEREVRRAMGAV